MSPQKMLTDNIGKMQVPAMVHQHLDVIQHHKDGGVYLGASSRTGRYWMGSLWFFDDPKSAPNVEKCEAGVDLDSGVNDLKTFQTSNVLLGMDSGSVQIWQLNEEKNCLTCKAGATEHDDFVSSVSISADESRAVSGSQDHRVKVWNLEDCCSTHTYTGHADAVHSVAFHPVDNEVFISCSQDGQALLWDLRKPKPASVIDISGLDSIPTCVAWQPTSEHCVCFGGEDGTLCHQDIRTNTSESQKSTKPHTRPVHRLQFSPHRSDWVASVSEDASAAVTSFSPRVKCIYKDSSYKDFVRGVSWDLQCAQHLITCSWDFTVQSYDIVEPTVNGMDIETAAQAVEGMEVASPASSLEQS